ncbi:hypothetical protein LF817_17300 [Halobacillus sp. A1]|uniref:hypothetical protein n=1 Tax=Halobacillus sp. A1 TaxID=2880262 RepID=UPI0020A68BDC|nr:hypothetical protein [Halobacillus sp. A1]MCP3033084.1 hypothetical protein [Halobacillus sp. A1]
MSEWWKSKKEVLRRKKRDDGRFYIVDFMIELLIYIPELLFLPIRLIILLGRAIPKVIIHIFDLV